MLAFSVHLFDYLLLRCESFLSFFILICILIVALFGRLLVLKDFPYLSGQDLLG